MPGGGCFAEVFDFSQSQPSRPANDERRQERGGPKESAAKEEDEESDRDHHEDGKLFGQSRNCRKRRHPRGGIDRFASNSALNEAAPGVLRSPA